MLNSKRPLIVGVPRTKLDDETRDLLKELNPVGYILFKRNCQDAKQLKALCDDLRGLDENYNPLIYIDQEGGRVNRIDWEDYTAPAGRKIGEIYELNVEEGLEAARLNGYILAAQLQEYGINVNCLPLADLFFPEADEVIGDRAFSANKETVAALCGATISGLMAGGCWGTLKHAPGHGRALCDSHKELPVVKTVHKELSTEDFYPFKVNNNSPMVMTAHVMYSDIDNNDCATDSPKMIDEILRGELGMTGVIISDDICMEALDGSMLERAERALAGGCDLLLHCNGNLEQMRELLALSTIIQPAQERIENLPSLGKPNLEMLEQAKTRMAELLS